MKRQPVVVETESEKEPKAHSGMFLKGGSLGLNNLKRRKFKFGHMIIIQFVRFFLGS